MSANSSQLPEPRPTAPDAARISEWLRRIRSAARAMLVTQRAGWIIAAAILAVVIGGFADFFLRAPMELRIIGLLLAVGTLGWFILRFLLPALRFHPSLTEIALRIEKSDPGLRAGVRGLLASGLELGHNPEALPAPQLAGTVVAEAADKLTAVRAREVFSPRPTFRALGACVATGIIVAGLCFSWPQHSRIGMARMLWPFGNAEWPKLTEIADATRLEHHPLGTALPLRAVLVRSDRPAARTTVAAHYRVLTDGSPGPDRQVLLTEQPDVYDQGTLAGGTQANGVLFERLIEPTGLAPTRPDTATPGKTELEYWFATGDDSTARKRILLIDPPAVVHASATITLPEYASKLLGSATIAGPQRLDLGPGSDDRAAPPAFLAGSRIVVTLEFNKPLALPASLDPSQPETQAWIQSTLGPEAPFLFAHPPTGPSSDAHIASESGGRSWVLSWQHWESVRLIVKPTDSYQIAAGEEAVFRFDALKDNPPTATVTLPAEDKSVLPTAVVEIAGEARDDVALSWVALERQLARKNPSSEGAVPEAAQERVEMARLTAAQAATEPVPDGEPAPSSIKRLVSSYTLDLTAIPDLKPGDELWITAVAADAFELSGQRHDPVRSTSRKLRILSREQLVEQLWSELANLRRTAIKIDQDQSDIAKAAPPAGPAGEEASARAERAQAGLTERLSRQTQGLQRLQQRIKENALTDQNIADVLRQASETLGRAGQQSAQASQDLGQASKEQSQQAAPETAGQKDIAKAGQEQQAVRDELANLIDMLDQGEDSFAAKRAVERMLDQQKSLRDRTGQTGRQTAGKPADELSQQQKDDLEKISQDQKALADQLREAVKKMQDRESKLAKNDPAAAQAMAEAAAQALRDQTPERMDQASQQAQNNQTSSAQQQQTQAIQSLQQMLEKIQQAQANKDEVLRRKLAKLAESLKALIEVQKIAINALEQAIPQGASEIAKLEQPMILHHQNTLGVLEEASSMRELAAVAQAIEKAADAMAAAVPQLRRAEGEPALENENTALERLNEALEMANKLDQSAQQRQNDRKRAELRSRYEAALKVQIELRDSSQGLVGAEDNRRTKAAARLIAQDQSALKDTVDQIRADTAEIAKAKVFDYAHDRLDSLMDAAGTKLGEGAADSAVVRSQTSAARLLKSLADALDDSKDDDKRFREQESGGGGGGGSKPPPVVPDSAEVVLLRLMQQEALDLSRAAADSPAPDAGVLDAAADLQRDIADQGKALLKRLQKEQAEPPKPGVKPAPKPAPAPDQPDKPEGGPQFGAPPGEFVVRPVVIFDPPSSAPPSSKTQPTVISWIPIFSAPQPDHAIFKIRIFRIFYPESLEQANRSPDFSDPNVFDDGIASFQVVPALLDNQAASAALPACSPRLQPWVEYAGDTSGPHPFTARFNGLPFIEASATLASDPPAPSPTDKPPAKPEDKPKTAPPSPQPSLDELLGIKPKPAPDKPKPDEPTEPSPPTPDASQPDLDRLLTAQEMGDAFKQAITLMGDASARLVDHKDPGLDTQRVQEDVIKRLDQLLASLQRQKQQGGSSSSSQQDKSGKQQPPPTGNQKQQSKPQPGGAGERKDLGPTLQQGTLRPELESARAAWGSLPARIRDMLMQGTEDRFSARYKALTQEYYKRLAEENSR